jgi:hypothetical protein
MARRRSYNRRSYRRYYPKARRVYSRARGSSNKKLMGNVLDGAVVGAVQGMVPDNALWGYGDALVPIGVGWFRKNPVLQTIGGYQLGLKIASSMSRQGGSPGFTGQ